MMPLGHIGIPLLIPLIKKDIIIDIRLLVIGSILSDLIDKPLGHFILPENNGRIFAHTLLFVLILFAAGLIYRPVMGLTIGASIHLILDGMFLDPRTALWPLFGPFESMDFKIYDWIDAFSEPYVIAEELTGLILIAIFVIRFRLYDPSILRSFISNGRTTTLQNHLYKKDMK